MKRILFFLTVSLAVLAASAQSSTGAALPLQSLHNPVLQGFHPDPSVCRVGEDYYMVNSSFQYFPGVPIYHSRDLVNWTLIGNVLDRASQLPLQGANSWTGIYAPTLRYHDGTFYMVTTNVGQGGNFMVTARHPTGPWSEPIRLKQQGIDPSLYFEDGRCYLVSNPDNTIMLCEIDPATGRQLTESRPLWQGTGGRYPEGPHIYKKDGYYYLLISEGGTELAHRLTIARSKRIEGPYKPCPHNPLLTNCSLAGQSMQIQGTGHGDLVQAADGSWWVLLLAYRNFGGAYHHLGRETCLAPVQWEKGRWPVINGGQPIDTLMQAPLLAPQQRRSRHIHTRFDGSKLGPEWVHLQQPITANYQQQDGRLRLKGNGSLTDNQQPTYVGRRQEHERIVVETELDAERMGFGLEAGLSVYQSPNGHFDLALEKYMTGTVAVVMNYRVKSLTGQEMGECGQTDKVRLRITSDGQQYHFLYSLNGGQWQQLASHDCQLLSTEVVGGFTGVTIGMYADGEETADFNYFDYTELP